MENVYFITSDGELRHHGVRGMKWGVRRYQNPDGSLTAAGKKHRSEQENLYYDPDFLSRTIATPRGRTIRVTDMATNRSTVADKIAEWSEAEDGKIRDDFRSGRISRKEAMRRYDDLAEETDRRYRENEKRRIISGERALTKTRLWFMPWVTIVNQPVNSQMVQQAHQQAHQQAIQNQQLINQLTTQQAMEQANHTAMMASLQNNSLALSGGMTPFMFG